eukprot:5620560-Pleurochrysis_carterae.AAC.1
MTKTWALQHFLECSAQRRSYYNARRRAARGGQRKAPAGCEGGTAQGIKLRERSSALSRQTARVALL